VPTVRRRFGATARRAGWSFVDQALSSATNFALGIFVAAVTVPAELGAFSLVYAAYGVCLGLSAGLVSTPLVVRFSARAGTAPATAALRSVRAALAVGLVSGLVVVLAATVLPTSVRSSVLVLGLGLPGLLTQEAWRFAFVAQGRSAAAAANDAVWAVLQ
jgi:O-antigen/teichoic acid export membrane protein